MDHISVIHDRTTPANWFFLYSFFRTASFFISVMRVQRRAAMSMIQATICGKSPQLAKGNGRRPVALLIVPVTIAILDVVVVTILCCTDADAFN